MYCRICGKEITEGSLSCDQCGTLVSNDLDNYLIHNYCTKCGSQIVDVNGICLNCLKNSQTDKDKQIDNEVENKNVEVVQEVIDEPSISINKNETKPNEITATNSISKIIEKTEDKYAYFKQIRVGKNEKKLNAFKELKEMYIEHEDRRYINYPNYFNEISVRILVAVFFIIVSLIVSCVKINIDRDSSSNENTTSSVNLNLSREFTLILDNEQNYSLNQFEYLKFVPTSTTYYTLTVLNFESQDTNVKIYPVTKFNNSNAYSYTESVFNITTSYRRYLQSGIAYYYKIIILNSLNKDIVVKITQK